MDRLYNRRLEDGDFIYYEDGYRGDYHDYDMINSFLRIIHRLNLDDIYMRFYAKE
jgi:hypothetical protein